MLATTSGLFHRIITVPVGTTVSCLSEHSSWTGSTEGNSVNQEIADAGQPDIDETDQQHQYRSEGDVELDEGKHLVGESARNVLPRQVLADLTVPGATVIVAYGGQGGRGNAAFGARRNRYAPLQGCSIFGFEVT